MIQTNMFKQGLALKETLQNSSKLLLSDLHTFAKQAKSIVLLTLEIVSGKKRCNISTDTIFHLILGSDLSLCIVLTILLDVHASTFLLSIPVGICIGLAVSFVYYKNLQDKVESAGMLSAELGVKGLHHLLGAVPSWINLTDHERMQWLNMIISKIWPYLDVQICSLVTDFLDNIIKEQLVFRELPIRRVDIHNLTFGGRPLQIENVHTKEDTGNGLEMGFSIRGLDQASLSVFVQLGHGRSTLMCYHVTNFFFTGRLTLRLMPLTKTQLPGFGAIVLTCYKPPKWGFSLSGPSVGAGIVKTFLDLILNIVISNLLGFPSRLMLPIMKNNSDVIDAFARLNSHCGVVKVKVLQAEGLTATNIFGKYKAKTHWKRNTLDPVWKEEFWFLVQETTYQGLHVTVLSTSYYHLDSAGDGLRAKAIKRSRRTDVIGRCIVGIHAVAKVVSQEVQSWYPLGLGHWADPGGCGHGCGRIQLSMTYRHLETLLPREMASSSRGIITLRVLRISHLSKGRSKPVGKAVLQVTCNKEIFRTRGIPSRDGGVSHVFLFIRICEFNNVSYEETSVKIKVKERTGSGDVYLGQAEVPVSDVASSIDVNPVTKRPESGVFARTLPLEDTAHGEVSVIIRYIPYFWT
ncbi:hypothetical protein CEUSTIGMA_g11451.t1 [Chlamydomonas eustigma]|uniref:Uncharacterized protein n=1 Tax=Chlamydomonas eustigma TaxID=1157962 RepID=A0A250XLT5_9CHLO|nr:hypothetical protein CEUSTIGMA_g11451.t1 [Chlamydomonas eustigma]|eukprot:GAX84027.1 hypothetical protein CEUSTIGMA_g11451.t1 [Chlamydomonas eustigma]